MEHERERNLRLNADKLKLKMTQVSYIGHLLTREGLRVDPKKVEAIEQMPAQKGAKDVRRLMGSVNYLAKFVRHLSNIMQPLRRLLDKDTEWCWLHTHQQAFDEMKKALTMTPSLSYYDVMKPVVIQCDAYDSGLDAALLQNGLPVCYSSLALTSADANYAQFEKELLAIVLACEKIDKYVYGRDKVRVQSDHKPMHVIFKRPLMTAPKRLRRMLLRLQRYSLEVTYVRGSDMYIADTLSRAYIPGNPQSRSQISTWPKDCQCLSGYCRSYEIPPRVTVFSRKSYRLPSEGGLHKRQTLTLMCALTITCSTN